MNRWATNTGVSVLLFIFTSLVNAEEIKPAMGYGDVSYEVPVPGSYALPPLGLAADGQIINGLNQQLSLFDLFDNKYVLLSFMYSRCDDINGCPLSAHVLYQIKVAMNKEAELSEHLKLVSLSFDPEHDTPEVLKLYANNFKYAGNQGSWDFISTETEQKLIPILKAYNQDIQREVTLAGGSERYSHLLRVFLIDPKKQIRNIYSVAFLHKDLLINDVKTLLMEQSTSKISAKVKFQKFNSARPGDDKRDYESAEYVTHTQSLEMRNGKAINLLAQAKNPPLGLPVVPEPDSNLLTQEKIALGRKLFFDRRLSLNDTFSCAMCHIPEQGFSSNELATAVGIEGRSVRRNSPTIYNIAYANILFHDGREFNLEQQIWGPLLAKNEMGNPSVGFVINKIKQLKDYSGLFEKAFEGNRVSMETLGQAFASYQRTLVSANSAFDRWFYGQQANALNESARRGFELFNGKAACSSCHVIGTKHALFTDNLLHNTGMGYQESMGIRADKERIQLAPGVFVNVDSNIISQVGESLPADVGQYEVTENPSHRWKYKTPSLRNISLTGPYMHNGKLSTLMDVVEFYNQGGVKNELLDPRIKPLHLSQQQKEDLVSFLHSLTGSNVDQLVSDAFAAPIGDTHYDTSRQGSSGAGL